MTNVLGGESEPVCYLYWWVRDSKLTTTQSTGIEEKPHPTSSISSQRQRESVSVGTGMADLGGVGNTNSK